MKLKEEKPMQINQLKKDDKSVKKMIFYIKLVRLIQERLAYV